MGEIRSLSQYNYSHCFPRAGSFGNPQFADGLGGEFQKGTFILNSGAIFCRALQNFGSTAVGTAGVFSQIGTFFGMGQNSVQTQSNYSGMQLHYSSAAEAQAAMRDAMLQRQLQYQQQQMSQPWGGVSGSSFPPAAYQPTVAAAPPAYNPQVAAGPGTVTAYAVPVSQNLTNYSQSQGGGTAQPVITVQPVLNNAASRELAARVAHDMAAAQNRSESGLGVMQQQASSLGFTTEQPRARQVAHRPEPQQQQTQVVAKAEPYRSPNSLEGGGYAPEPSSASVPMAQGFTKGGGATRHA